ncbi:DNA cytosine methyltransferase [Rossellomorea aquimaris]|uniref:DNA cytosine methyltransferase n=1 Tax=Rossellomorea aquimaris TaxID=189382 RepID=UPI0005C8E478|nr:DNA cytosine methyltransferase [Rossellomorea aquimaris]
MLDLFAGGGGFSTGFLQAKEEYLRFEIHRALEINDSACDTLRNHIGKDRVIQGDITEETVKSEVINSCKDVDVIIGGPPCQTFSLAGPARSGSKEMREKLKDDPRNTLYKHFFELVSIIKPSYAVFENVEGMQHLGINDKDSSKKLISHQSREHNFRDVIIFILTKEGSNSSRFINPLSGDYHNFLNELYPYARNKHKDTYDAKEEKIMVNS